MSALLGADGSPGHNGQASSTPISTTHDEKLRREYEDKFMQQHNVIQQLLKRQDELETQLREAQNTIKALREKQNGI
jgi:predicted RNase H-like nuclease (RuvC/YqgF family)